jgi:hypothetical protein
MLCFSRASVHPVPSTSLSHCSSADTTVLMLYTDGALVHPVLKTPQPSRVCKLSRDRRIDRRFLLTKASVHPVLKTSSWRIFVLIQTECRIDRQCPRSDRRIIRCYCLCCSSSAIHLMHLGIGASIHPTVSTSFFSAAQCTNYTDANAPMVPSVHLTVCSLFLSLLGFDPRKINYLLNLACDILASLGPRNVYKDMLNNMVSLINLVVMNHQNQTRTNGKWGHVSYKTLATPLLSRVPQSQ